MIGLRERDSAPLEERRCAAYLAHVLDPLLHKSGKGRIPDQCAYSVPSLFKDDFLIYSKGSDGIADAWNYDPSNELGGIFEGQDPSKDLVNLSGGFIRAPKSLVNEKGYSNFMGTGH